MCPQRLCSGKLFFRDVLEILPWISLFICIYGAAIVYLCTVLVRHQRRQIASVAEGIANFHGYEENYYLQKSKNEDINLIIDQFNTMAEHIYALTQKVELAHKNTEKEMELRRIAEIKTLEAQINPHFLYNTLDTINWIALENNELEISEMLGALGSLLRYSVTNIDMVVLVKAEIEWIKNICICSRNGSETCFSMKSRRSRKPNIFPSTKCCCSHWWKTRCFTGSPTLPKGKDSNRNQKSRGKGPLYRNRG